MTTADLPAALVSINGERVYFSPDRVEFTSTEAAKDTPDLTASFTITGTLGTSGGTPTLNSLTKWHWRKDVLSNIRHGDGNTRAWAEYPMFSEMFSWKL